MWSLWFAPDDWCDALVSKALDDNACGTVIVPAPCVRVTQMLLALADIVIDLPDGDSFFEAKDGCVPLQFEFAVAFVILSFKAVVAKLPSVYMVAAILPDWDRLVPQPVISLLSRWARC